MKAFSTATRMTERVIDGVAVDGFVAGDDPEAKATVLDLVESIGFRPVGAGPLPMARALEAIAWLKIHLNMSHGWAWQSGWTLVEPTTLAA